MSMLLGCKDIGIRKSEFVAKTQFLSIWKVNMVYRLDTIQALYFRLNTNLKIVNCNLKAV